jgi:hypothetical protein
MSSEATVVARVRAAADFMVESREEVGQNDSFEDIFVFSIST